ncbi:MAG: hypothetical protein ABIT08_12010 [Bacteroidia bacterium]
MQDSKFNFSDDEFNLIKNQDFFKKKTIITKKMVSLFHELNDGIEKIKKERENLPGAEKNISGKISKGENYLGLPYLVLDNPRVFSNKNIFAFRSMFWWGNYFSFTFHLSGKYLEDYKRNIYKNSETLKGKKILICIHHEQWVHHLEKENYENIDSFDSKRIKNLIEENGFLKLSRKLDLQKWKHITDFGIETLNEYFSLLGL